jgi:hypothetical protein
MNQGQNNCLNRLSPYQYIAPYYGPTVCCSAMECDPCEPPREVVSPELRPFNIVEANDTVARNIENGGWHTAYGWCGDLSARVYDRQFFDGMFGNPINYYWTRPPHTDYAWERCQNNKGHHSPQ